MLKSDQPRNVFRAFDENKILPINLFPPFYHIYAQFLHISVIIYRIYSLSSEIIY